MKSFISSILNAFAKDNIGFACFIFANFNEGSKPIVLVTESYFFKKGFCFSNSTTFFFRSSNSWSVTIGESLS